jgi:hypothetical protein
MAWAAAIESKRNRWWRAAAALIGTVGLGSSLVQGTTLAALPIRLDEPRVFSLAVLIAWGAMRLTRLAHAWRKGPVVERVALAATFLIAGPLLVLDVARAGIWVVVLVALASGATAVATPLPAGRPA